MNLNKISKIKLNKKEQLINILKQNGLLLLEAQDELKDDKDVVITAIRENSMALRFASQRLKNDEDIVREAIYNDPFKLYFASERLQNNKILLEILENYILINKIQLNEREKSWYDERMAVLNSLKEKELMEDSITPNNKTNKKNKF